MAKLFDPEQPDSFYTLLNTLVDFATLDSGRINTLLTTVQQSNARLLTLITGQSVTNSNLNTLVDTMDSMVSRLDDLITHTSAIAGAIGPIVPPADETVRDLLSGTNSHWLTYLSGFGTLPNPGVSTALGLLNKIAECGCSTSAPNELACSDAFVSNGVAVAAPGNESYSFAGTYAKWPDPLPTGIGRALTPPWDIPEEEYTGMFSSIWGAFYIYVQSEAPYFRLVPELGAATYETKKWVQVPSGLDNIAVVVDPAFTLTAYLCRDADYNIQYGNAGCTEVVVPSAIGNEITVVVDNTNGKVGSITAQAGRLPVYIHEGYTLGQDTTGFPAAEELTTVGQVYHFAPGIERVGMTVGPNSPGSVKVCFAE